MQTAMTLRTYGFLLTQNGRVLATDGEMTVEMANGVAYTLRFGDVASGVADAANDLNARFAGWFYVIANTDFQKLRLSKKDLLR